MMRTVLLLSLCALLGGSTPARAQEAKETPAKPPIKKNLPATRVAGDDEAPATVTGDPGEDNDVETYQMDNKLDLGNVGLFLPDAQWKKLKTGMPKMKVGGWAEYEITHPQFNLGSMRLSVVPQDGLPGPSWRILEILSIDGTGDKTYVKIAFQKASSDLRNARGMIMKPAGMPPLVLPIGNDPEQKFQDAFSINVEVSDTHLPKVKYLGKKTIEVPAGKFETWHYRFDGKRPDGKAYSSEIWFDVVGIVPVLRVVRATEQDTVMELKAKGEGAKSDLPYLPVGN
ncbi:MAG: hypothetical protein P1V51_05655 [Deltaproteobacteria bacterium]|nr:hypothetical protein [Deltaproteobacteria bacterium]